MINNKFKIAISFIITSSMIAVAFCLLIQKKVALQHTFPLLFGLFLASCFAQILLITAYDAFFKNKNNQNDNKLFNRTAAIVSSHFLLCLSTLIFIFILKTQSVLEQDLTKNMLISFSLMFVILLIVELAIGASMYHLEKRDDIHHHMNGSNISHHVKNTDAQQLCQRNQDNNHPDAQQIRNHDAQQSRNLPTAPPPEGDNLRNNYHAVQQIHNLTTAPPPEGDNLRNNSCCTTKSQSFYCTPEFCNYR